MSWLKRLIILSTLLLSHHSFALLSEDQKKDIKEVVLTYKKGIDEQSKSSVKKTSSKKFYQSMTKNQLLDRLFKKNKIKKDLDYEIEIIDSQVIENYIIAKVKSSESDEVDHFKIVNTKDGYKIDSKIHLDE